MFTLIAAVSAIPVFWLVEGEGFGGDDGHVEDEEDEMAEVEDDIDDAQPYSETRPMSLPTREEIEEYEEEEGYGGLAPLSRITTASSAAIYSQYDSSAESSRHPTPSASRRASTWSTAGPRRRSIVRRSSMPFGTGEQGVSRRFSTNLGASLGSAGGH